MTTTPSILARGETVAGFRIEDVIGIGGMAIVYRAEQVSLGRMVALKVLAPQLGSDEAFRERFRREGRHVASLDHPNVVAIYDSGEVDGRLYLAMRLVEGSTLAERMQFDGLSADETLRVLIPIASALDAAHGIGLVHRDVKPQNILLGDRDHPYLADFGVAKGSTTLGLTSTGAFVGSINYASPEQIQGEPASAAGDIYALTAVVYQCLAGRVPYPRDTDAGVMHAHLHEPPPTLPTLPIEAARLDEVIARGMAKDPSARHQRAGELLEDARAVISALPESRRRAVPAFTADTAAVDASPETDVDQTPGADQTPLAGQPPPDAIPPAPAVPSSDSTEVVSPSERAARRDQANQTTVDRRREPPPEPPTPVVPTPGATHPQVAPTPPEATATPAAVGARRRGWLTYVLVFLASAAVGAGGTFAVWWFEIRASTTASVEAVHRLPPPPPTNLQIQPHLISASLRWRQPAQTIQSFRVLENGNETPTLPASATHHTFVGLTPHTFYCFQVFTVSPTHTSSRDPARKCGWTKRVPAPQRLIARTPVPGHLVLTWRRSPLTDARYRVAVIRRSQIVVRKVTERRSISVTRLGQGQRYCATISTIWHGATSRPSRPACIRIKTKPSTPVIPSQSCTSMTGSPAPASYAGAYGNASLTEFWDTVQWSSVPGASVYTAVVTVAGSEVGSRTVSGLSTTVPLSSGSSSHFSPMEVTVTPYNNCSQAGTPVTAGFVGP